MKIFLKQHKKAILKSTAFIALIMIVTVLTGRMIGIDNIHNFVERMGARGPFGLVLVKASTVIFAPLSGTAIYMIGGSLFGVAKGFIYITIGNFLGMSVCFFIARKRGTKAVNRFFGKDGGEKILGIVDNLSTIKGLIIARVVLFPLEDFINYAAGLSRLKYRPFIVVSIFVTGVRALAMIYLGDISINI